MSTTEFKWDDEEFDDTFFSEVDKLEELATSLTQQQLHPPKPNSKPPSSAAPFYSPPPLTAAPQPLPPPPLPSRQWPVAGSSYADSNRNDSVMSYSPPKELSQRFRSNSSNQEQLEIEKLKCELNRVSKQLSDLKEECSELRRERDKRETLKSVHSNIEASTCGRNSEVLVMDCPRDGLSRRCQNVNASSSHAAPQMDIEQRSVGMQTDKDDECVNASTNTSTYCDLPELVSIWSSRNIHGSRRNFVAKLLETCATDFCLLFGCLGPQMASKMERERLTLVALPENVQGLHSAEVTGVSKLYTVLTKLSNDMVHVDTLVEVLLDLCSLENAVVVHRSLHILHVALDHLLSMDRSRLIRDNVKVEICHTRSDAMHIHDSEERKCGSTSDIAGDETSSSSYIAARENIVTTEHETLSLCHVDLVYLFEFMCQVATRLTVEDAIVEAVSIMNTILMRTHAYSERGKFGGTMVFEAVGLLLRKEASLFSKKEAVHLLYLLLNCPTILATFCLSCKDAYGRTQSPNDEAKSSGFQASGVILQGLADCLVCSGNGAKELNLGRNAIIVLAFLASSGKSGLEVFLFHKLSKRANFLGLILQVLVSEIDSETFESCSSPEISKERTLLIREALILLNRLASHPSYSATVLQVLTSCRDMVSLAIDIATRLSKRSGRLLKSDSVMRQMREYEVVDLARIFKKRVFSFLGVTISS